LNADKTSEEIKNALLRGIITFRGAAIQNDDVSMVVLKAL